MSERQTKNKAEEILLKVEHLQKYFPLKKKSVFQRNLEYVKANKDITISIRKGETLGLVGESGCGKSTFGRTLIQLYDQTGGSTLYYGDTIDNMMPAYVSKVYASLPSVFKDHDRDRAELDSLEEAVLKAGNDLEITDLSEKLRLKKIAFESKYGNIFRLAGGLLVHSDLEKVKSILSEKYKIGSKLAKVKRELDIQELKRDVANEKASSESKKLLSEQESIQKELERVNAQIDKLKSELSSHPKFKEYEERLDNGIDLSSLNKHEIRILRRDLQIIFQDPYSSLDPRFTVGNIIGEGLIAHGIFKNDKSEEYTNYIKDIMAKCGLDAEYVHRYPHQFSGGQRQRIGIARALALKPKFIVCDEAVSALDVSIQSQIINLLQDLKYENDLTYLFITHDLGVVRYIGDRIGVMYFGHLVELAPAEEIFSNPLHPYTRELLAAIPRMKTKEQEELFALDPEPNDIYDFTFRETGEADKDWYEATPEHFVACRLLDQKEIVKQ